MVGRSHLLIGLTAAVVLDSTVHLTGPALTLAPSVPLELVIKKAIFYLMVRSAHCYRILIMRTA